MKKRPIVCLLILSLTLIFVGCDLGAKVPVTPSGPKVTVLKLEPNSIELTPGEKRSFELKAELSDGSIRDLTYSNQFSYEASDSNIRVDSGYIWVDYRAPDNVNIDVIFEHDGVEAEMQMQVIPNPLSAIVINEDGEQIINNEERVDIVVNKQIHLSSTYIPNDLVVPVVSFPSSYEDALEKMHLRQEAADALEELFTAASEAEVELVAISGYRSYALQDRIFKYQVNRHGSEEEANRISARPGESEHQTGLAMDVSCAAVNYRLVEEFANTVEGQWLRDNCAKYGFVIRYLEEKEEITGYSYEPWHIRYVGKELAEQVMDLGVTLEEYFSGIR